MKVNYYAKTPTAGRPPHKKLILNGEGEYYAPYQIYLYKEREGLFYLLASGYEDSCFSDLGESCESISTLYARRLPLEEYCDYDYLESYLPEAVVKLLMKD